MTSHSHSTRRRFDRRFTLAAGMSLALVAAACGSSTETATDQASAQDASTTTVHDMSAMAGMNMGDPNATPAYDVDGAALASGDLVLLDTRPAGYDDAAGTAWMARGVKGTTVTVELSGLEPNVEYISHLHNDVCANNGGDHYQFEVGGSVMPPNEIHLAFTSDAEGNGFMTAENDQIAGLDAVAFVVHPAALLDNKIGCVDFVETEPGAAAAALAAGTIANGDTDHSDTDHSTAGADPKLPAAFDVEALHDLDDQLYEGTLDASTQGPIISAALEQLVGVDGDADIDRLREMLTELATAIENGDLPGATALAADGHDLAHDLAGH